MLQSRRYRSNLQLPALLLVLTQTVIASADAPEVDYLTFARGALPVKLGGAGPELKVGMEQALAMIDGDVGGFSLTPKPGAPDTEIIFVYELPAPTRFTEFAVPNVRETPSPSQTFVRDVEIAGGGSGPDGPFKILATTTLTTHDERDQLTRIPSSSAESVSWVQVRLRGGIDIQRDKTFFESSEIIGHGSQDAVPLLDKFTGKWKGRGVKLELKQDGVRVGGCYDADGELAGTVTGNLLRATGTTAAGIASTFVLTVTDEGEITGVRSTNGAPFVLYTGAASTSFRTGCSDNPTIKPPVCGSIVHGINFDYDSASIRTESGVVLDALFEGLQTVSDSSIEIIGHTSSEGAEAYNQDLSQRRAAAVVAALAARGIAESRLSARGIGEAAPIADNRTEAGRSLNRRVEISCQ